MTRALTPWLCLLAVAGASASGCRRAKPAEVDAALLPSGGPTIVSFASGGVTLQGVLYKPDGAGPFPAVLFNHGSGPGVTGDVSDALNQVLGKRFASHVWVFFAPWRRGQGLSERAGSYIKDEINDV
jgi:hypothetical protein